MKTILELKTPRTGEETPEAMAQFLASLASVKYRTPVNLEIAFINQSIHFYIVVPAGYEEFVESQLYAQYPKVTITRQKDDPISVAFTDHEFLSFGQIKLQHNSLYPIKTFRDFKEVDPLSSILGMLSKLSKDDTALIQISLIPAGTKWQRKGQKALEKKAKESLETADPLLIKTYSKQIGDKVAYPGFRVGIRLLVKSPNDSLIDLIAATFSNFDNITGNSFKLTYPQFWQKKKFLASILLRTGDYIPNRQILNIMELASIIHLPNVKLSTIPGLNWSKTILSEPPDNLPIAINLTEEEKKDVNFFARTDFRNQLTNFGILKTDRRRHVYIIGKTGTGKSTLIANMAINDIRNGEGMAIIDPHGDLSETILEFIPSYRVNDIVYLNPGDIEHPFHINPLEISNPSQKELVGSGIVSIFYKLYANSWGPRLEYILRNTILTLLEVPNATLLMVPEILTNAKFRKKITEELKDPVLKNFWNNEFELMTPQLKNEATGPILNKVGQFLSSQMIRNIVGSPKSTINLEDIMNNGKIVIMNLSQGRIGEDNAALLGAMIITKLQLAAMNRVNIPEDQRADFYLYVDEFQNFATTSFIKILSEARKYRLDLILANQYSAQIDPAVRSAIFGNAGTIITFLVGAEDAPILAKEFGERFTVDDILALGNYQMIAKMCINSLTSSPFFAQSLPLPQSKTQNKEKVIKVSQEHYTKEFKDNEKVDETIEPATINSSEIFKRLVS